MNKIKYLVLVVVMATGTFSIYAEDKLIKIVKTKAKQEGETTTPKKSASAPRGGQQLHTHAIGLGIGQTSLYGDFSDYGEDKITYDFFYTYAASYSFDFVTNIHYSKHEHKDYYVELKGVNFGIKAKWFHFDSFSPYLQAGLGFYRPEVKRMIGSDIVVSEEKTTFGTAWGAGAELRLNRHFMIGVLFQFHNPFDVKQDRGSDIEGSYNKLMMMFTYIF